MTSYQHLLTEELSEKIEEVYSRYKDLSADEILRLFGRNCAATTNYMTDADREFNERLKEIPISEIEKVRIKYNL